MIIQPLIGSVLTPYAIILSLSAALGLGLSVWLTREDKLLVLDAGLVILFVGLMGARIGFVLRNLSFYLNNPIEIPQLWLGGLSWPGALLGGAAGLLIAHLIWKLSLGELADRFLPLLGVLSVAIWLTGWGAGIGYGPRVEAWYGIKVRDNLGLVSRRWPLPILGAVLTALWITGSILFPLKRERRPGFRAVSGLGGLAGINLVISLFRVSPAPVLWGLRWETWFSILFLLGVAIYMVLEINEVKL